MRVPARDIKSMILVRFRPIPLKSRPTDRSEEQSRRAVTGFVTLQAFSRATFQRYRPIATASEEWIFGVHGLAGIKLSSGIKGPQHPSNAEIVSCAQRRCQ